MSGKVLDIEKAIGVRDAVAKEITHWWDRWNTQRQGWVNQKNELRNFLFAIDTRTTSAGDLPWKNSTVRPKITQIRDNLHSNYLSALFPNENWLRWEGYNRDSETKAKRLAIEGYMKNKIRISHFRDTISTLLLDYIDYGICFGDSEFIVDQYKADDGKVVTNYIGPKLRRYAPQDVVFNPTAPSFEESPKIRRYLKSLGDLIHDAKIQPEVSDLFLSALERAEYVRSINGNFSTDDWSKYKAFAVDGFGNLQDYYGSGLVEFLEFTGTLYDRNSGLYFHNYKITIIDRSYVIEQEPIPNWFNKGTMQSTTWRKRPDNLYGMGPLDNLVGMQYRIDHLENLKADVFDLVAHPPLKIKGNVEEFEWGPGAEIYLGDDGEVEPLVIDAQALNADLQISILEQSMEEMAGAPKQAMGIRTPGEKTAYEVSQLENAAGRIFKEKVDQFEQEFLEPILNVMLEQSRRNMEYGEIIRVQDNSEAVVDFIKVTREDITSAGKLRPVGSRHFAMQSQLAQNLNGIFTSQVGQIIAPHVSSIQLAQLVEDLFGLERYALFAPNIALEEQYTAGQLSQAMNQDLAVQQATPVG